MTTDANQPGAEQDVVSGYYENYKETQAEIFARDSRRVRNSLIWIALLLFASSFLALAMIDAVYSENIIKALIYPVLFTAFAFLGLKQPMLAVVLAILLFLFIVIMSIVAYGGLGAISGILIKAIIIYFLLAGLQSAKSAEQAKKELNS